MQPGSSYTFVPIGEDAKNVHAGDFILVHGTGWMAKMVGFGEYIRFRNGYWRHAAYCESPTVLIEALPPRVRFTPLANYRGVDYVHVQTGMRHRDACQANAFARGCVGQEYGFITDAGIFMRFCTPGSGLWFGVNGTRICSGLVAEAETRGWAVFKGNPSSLSPTELGREYDVPPRLTAQS
jgi:hypothetical protein